MERKSDEAALQPVVDRERKRDADVRVHRWLVVVIEDVEESARVVGKPAAVGEIADVVDARPAGGHDVLLSRPELARVRQPRHVADFEHQPALEDGRRHRTTDDRIAALRGECSSDAERQE